jgi:squalene-hopene/tetraprenyl-beta-curcumene cyclase
VPAGSATSVAPPSPSARPATNGRAGVAAPTSASAALDAAIARARDSLLAKQDPAGFWCGELQGDSILESEYLLLKFILGQENDPDLPLIANYLRRLQQPDGGWGQYPGGPPDVSGTVKAYFALKLMGDDPESSHMRRAREVCLRLGGAAKCNSFSNFFLAALGQISYDDCPNIPPEIVLLPKWAYFNLYAVSAWTRTMILPLAIVSTLRPVGKVAEARGIAELFVPRGAGEPSALEARFPPRGWRDIFLLADRFLKFYAQSPIELLRQHAMKRAEEWLLEHLDGSEGLGAIFPPMVYILIVFRVLGYPEDHPRVVQAHKHLRDFYIREGDTIRLQPCVSPVWDTGLALHALAEAGMEAESEGAGRSTRWLLEKECRVASDWRANCPNAEPSGWFFEFSNPHYPDVDDTAMVTMSLNRVGGDGQEVAGARYRGLSWLLAMQNDDGGWAAFDRTQDRPILEQIPFADHNAMQDPSCPDITGRVLECLGHCGLDASHATVQRAVKFIRSRQDKDGCWFGRWGVNYVYGTWQVLVGLRAVGVRMDQEFVLRAAAWLRGCQKGDGSWGESCATYDDPSLKGQGESTASQTAWGAMGLLAVAGPEDADVKRGVEWLVGTQAAHGGWDEEFFTGTGFPKVFYLRYHLYRHYFPLMALGRYRKLGGRC